MPFLFKVNLLKYFLVYIFSTSLSSHDCLTMDVAKTVFNNEGKQPIMVLDNTISLEAYCGQEKLNYLINKKYNDKIGYKVGFTGKALERFNIKSPASGVLYKHMFLKNDAFAALIAYRTFIEPDMLVIIKSSDIMNAKAL